MEILRIYQAVDNPYASVNQYVSTLIEGVKSLSREIEFGWGIDTFWCDDIYSYDIIHIQWPHVLLINNWHSNHLKERLTLIKKRGKKIVATCHNLVPHYNNNYDFGVAYETVYNFADMIIHLGPVSKELLSSSYPNAEHVIIPHHIYDTFYTHFPEKEESCKKLKISKKNNYILCYGAFRDDEERLLAQSISCAYKYNSTYILAPSYDFNIKTSFFNRYKYFIKEKLLYQKKHIISLGYKNYTIPNELTPYFFGAATIVLIQRKKILNSGNVPLAFLMGKVVVGPNIGNVGRLLNETGNPTFDVNDIDSLKKAIDNGFQLANDNYGEKNRTFAFSNLSTNIISQKLYEHYCTLIH